MNFEQYQLSLESKSALVSIVCDSVEGHRTDSETSHSLDELSELMRTLDIEVTGRYIQNKKQLESGTVLGKGKLQEIAEQAKSEGTSLLVFDFELTGSQVRNIKKLTGLDVIDRVTVILEIFARHAQTKEAKIQIEVSRLQYLLPRLSTLWSHFTRQKGGIGLKGEGEQQLELDRRIIRRRIETLKQQLSDLKISREEQRKKRSKKAVVAALVGYTNVGKSSIMNKLCGVDVLSENKLFATLDSTFRMLNPDTRPPMILIDTVGFISNLPSSLVEGFKTTLESAVEADLLVIVSDVNSPSLQKQLKVTEETLEDLGIQDKPRFYVFNKKDLLQNPLAGKVAMGKYPNSYLVSTSDSEDMENLKHEILQFFLDRQQTFDVFIPYSDGAGHSKISSQTNVINTGHHENGTFYRVRVPNFIFEQLNLKKYVLAPEESKKFL